MGPAIRHTVAKLDDVAAKVKLLILVSDGRPEDEDYGPERGSIDYPLHDTRKALLEARRRRIEPFLITVDSTGADYLAQMCDDLGYEVVADVESLPRRLTRLYRHLTTE
jgi:nitric oxide reductase NorD protein